MAEPSTDDDSRILLLTDADVFAGTEKHIFDLAGALRDAGVEVSIGCPIPSALADRLSPTGIPVIAIPKRRGFDWRAVLTLRRLLRSKQIVLIHAHNGRTAFLATVAAWLAGTGTIVQTQHFLAPSYASRRGIKRWISNRVHTWVDRRLAHVIVISQAVRRGALERGEGEPDHFTVIPNGICASTQPSAEACAAVRLSLGIGSADPLIVCAARLEPEKDLATLIRAMGIVARDDPRVRCAIAGHGSQEKLLRGLIAELNLEHVVTLLGFRPDVATVIAAGDIFVLPSTAEPFGLVLIEAMAMVKPVIATRAGGPLEIVVDGETGLLVPPGDPAGMAAAISTLINDPARREPMGQRGFARFEECFTARRMAEATAAVYRKVLGRHIADPKQDGARDAQSNALAERPL